MKAGCALGVLLLATSACRDAPPRHLVLITLDTLRSDRLGSYGHERNTTPHLDRLAARGVRFDDAIAQSNATPPSHASILTGLYPPRHGLRRLWNHELPDENETLAERLAERGFETAAFVSALPLRRAVGLDQGFAHYDAPFDGARPERPAAETTAAVRSWLPGRGEGRLFLWVHYFDPHHPYFAPPEVRARFDVGALGPGDVLASRPRAQPGDPEPPYPERAVRRMADLYDAEVAYTDEALGALLRALDEADVLGEAVVAVVADHGELLGEHGYFFGHWGVWEETASVPMLLAHPAGRFAGREVREPVASVDLVPTLLAWLGIDVPAGLDGIDLTPGLEGAAWPERAIYSEQREYFPMETLRTAQQLLVRFGGARDEAGAGRLFARRRGSRYAVARAREPAERRRLLGLLDALGRPGSAPPSRELAIPDDVAQGLRALGYAGEVRDPP